MFQPSARRSTGPAHGCHVLGVRAVLVHGAGRQGAHGRLPQLRQRLRHLVQHQLFLS